MKHPAILLAGLALIAASCTTKSYKDPSLPAETRAKLLLAQMTQEEKIGQMCQYVAPGYVPPGQGSPYKNIDATDENMGQPGMADKIREGRVGSFLHCLTAHEAATLQTIAQQSRLGIPLLLGVDAVHGNALHMGCTVYPTNINLAATFNPELAEQIGEETAYEMRRTGMYWTFAPNLDVARDARWGRMGETFGEDPYLVSQMGKYIIWGLQGRNGAAGIDSLHVIACAKHLIGGGEPFGGINAAPMDMSERKLRELYLPPFVVAVKEAQVATVMTAHNEINGIPCHGNSWLVNDLLRGELGFDGFVVSDWMDIERLHSMHHWVPSEDEAFKVSVEAGIDMHMQGDNYFESVLDGVRSGRIPQKRIDQAALKILEAKFRLGLFENPVPDTTGARRASVVGVKGSAEHHKTALTAARQSIVLLKNEGAMLPLSKTAAKRIFVVGPNADSQTLLGDWAIPQPDDAVVTVYEGIKNAVPAGVSVEKMDFDGRIALVDKAGIKAAAAKAAASDLNVVVVGENSQRYSAFGCTCGENNDRDNIDLPGLQEELLEAVWASGKPTVLVLLNGRALGTTWADENVKAIVEAFEPGMMGGQAVAEVLFGDVNPSGKLPVTVPRNAGQIQTVYNHKHSQYSRKFAMGPTGALYHFGYGLSYTTFDYSDATLSCSQMGTKDSAKLSVKLTNSGSRDGDEVVQVYIRDEYGSVTRPVKELKAFRRVSLKAGESQTLEFDITPEMLQCYGAQNSWSVEPGDFTIMVGSSSRDEDLISLPLQVI